MNIITAKEARATQADTQYSYETVLQYVDNAIRMASIQKFAPPYVKLDRYGFGDTNIYCGEEHYNEVCKQIISLLRNNGYSVTISSNSDGMVTKVCWL
jgi:hypothetical protein